MGTQSMILSRQNRLFWLGRYTERVFFMLRVMMARLDDAVDGEAVDYADICARLGIPNVYQDEADFCHRYLYDLSNPDSIKSAADAMLGNGTVLRETLSTPTLAYLQMACTALELAEKSTSPDVELQWVLDDIMAFRGSCDDTVDEEKIRNIIKVGMLVERISLSLRLEQDLDGLSRELRKLINRIYKTALPTDAVALDTVTAAAMNMSEVGQDALCHSVETLFQV